MPTAPSLRDLQRELETLFSLGGEADHADRLRDTAPRLPIGGDDRLTPADRLGIYTGMIFVRIRDAIAEDFAATRTALGDDAWNELIARYLRAHPTHHADLRLAPRHLPEFLRATAPGPLADLAELEWALMESFTAEDSTPLRATALANLAPDAWPEMLVRASPSLRLLHPHSDVDRNRRRLLDREAVELGPTAPFALRVWRRDLRVFHKRIDAVERGALELARSGVTFADLCAWLADHGDGDPSQAAVRLLHVWLADELLVAP